MMILPEVNSVDTLVHNSLSLASFCVLASRREKLNHWNMAHIAVGAILFVIGLVGAVVLAVLLYLRIKANRQLLTCVQSCV